MTCGSMLRGDLLECRHYSMADLLGVGTARSEGAARRRSERRGDFAFEQDAMARALEARVGDGNG